MADHSFGQKAVGLSFNPAGNPEVNNLKELAAAFIDACNDARNLSGDGEVKRMYSVAITEAQTAQMWAVKAATWNLPKGSNGSTPQMAPTSSTQQPSKQDNSSTSPSSAASSQSASENSADPQSGSTSAEDSASGASDGQSSTDDTNGQPNIGSEASA